MASIELEKLNPAQQEAATAGAGPILILAGAGSGKTRVLTHRIAYQLSERQCAPEQLLAVTFTNKAAGEMRERLATLLGPLAGRLWISTFHSACARILRQEIGVLGYSRNFTVFDESDSNRTILRAIEAANLSHSPPLAIVRARIDQAKNEGLLPEQLMAQDPTPETAVIGELYRLYQRQLREFNAVDFGDLLLLVHQLWREHPEVLKRWQERFSYLLVDEYQDTNRVQYLLLKELAAASGNLCVVGDEDQSIYRWRGADIRNILEFERDYPNARIFKLEQNYRSTKTILAAAHSVISNNQERKPKQLWTDNEAGERIVQHLASTERDEAEFICREIGRLSTAGSKLADVVVFYRTNAQARVLEEALVRHRLPYYVVGGLRFYEQREIKDLLAYLRVLANPADAISLERLVGVPPRGIGAKTVEVLNAAAARQGCTLFEAMGRAEAESAIALRIGRQAGALHEWMAHLVERAGQMTVRALLDEVLERSAFIAYLEGLTDGAQRRESVAELLSAADNFDTEHGPGGLADFLERVALVSDADQVAAAGGSVTLMTLHTCKGLEYPVVFIAGMEEGLFPHSRSQGESEIEEERRLFYVGMTRARRLLFLTHTLSRELFGNRQEARPSRFLAEIDPNLIQRSQSGLRQEPIRVPQARDREPYVDYSESQVADAGADGEVRVGARVIHPSFGAGVVKRREGRGEQAKAWIQFDRGGTKLLLLKFAQLRPIAES